jgi:small GTP-binding protein
MKSPKIVVVGDGSVGKTCLLLVYARGVFPDEYVPTVFENYKTVVSMGGQDYAVQLWDTAGQEELESIRTLSYSHTDVFLLCYAVDDRTSFDNARDKWMMELRLHTREKLNVLLVGLKTDLREGNPTLSAEEGRALAKQLGAFDYAECSARKCEGVKEVFERAIEKAVVPTKEKKAEKPQGCCHVS